MTPTRAWGLIAVFVVVYNITSKPGGTLSEQADKWILRHPVIARAGILAVALHVANLVPSRVDVIHRFFAGIRATKAREEPAA